MSLHQPAFEGGRMVPYRHQSVQPLLPYEKHLIRTLGCTEEEYRQFAKEVERRVKERPEEYAHIPDIQNDATVIALVSLAVGIASTAASYLLTPKPKQPETPEQRRSGGQRQLGGAQGTAIFTPSFGFDSLQELASYGNTVPIVFTRRDDQHGTGGLLISPQLVWSRMKSWGGYQVAEIVAIAGQGNMERPDLAGIFLGNNALDGIYENYFDFYWNGGFEALGAGSRLRAYNRRYGNLAIDGNRDNPGINGSDQAFYAPTRQGAAQPAFCGSFTPTSQTRFGVYSGIPNGTPFRPDWKIFSVLKDWTKEQRDKAVSEQRKYVDGYLMKTHPYGNGDLYSGQTKAGMPGTGVNYARHVGVIEHISTDETSTTVKHDVLDTQFSASSKLEKWGNLTKTVEVNAGDQIVILLGKGRQQSDAFAGIGSELPVDLSDIRSTLDSEVQRYDQMLSVGATFMIGRSTWEVIDRPSERYDPEIHSANGYRIRLRCLEGWSRNQRKIGIVDEAAISQNKYLPFSDIEESFYPILRYEIGTFQNTRACDVTEIGIKSQVWTKFSNLTNFNTLPAPGIMARYNEENISLTEGKMTMFSRRISLFALDVRYSNNTDFTGNNANNGWANIGPYLFAIIGNAPVDIYSFIRVVHPDRSQLEFRLRPFNSAIPTQQSSGSENVFVLDGGKTPQTSWTFETYLGTFTVGGRGYFAKPRDIFTHPQMAVVPELIYDGDGSINLVYGEWIPGGLTVELESVTAISTSSGYSAGDPIRDNTLSNIMAIFFGEDPYFDNLAVGTRRKKTGWIYSDSNRSINMELEVEAYERNYETTPRNKWWRIVSTTVHDSSGNWSAGDVFNKNARNANQVQFAFRYSVSTGFVYVENDTPRTATRIFERYSGIAEVSHYGDLVSRSCDDAPEHEIVYVNETLDEEIPVNYDGCAMAGLKLKSSENFAQLDQLRCYLKNGIEVERLLDNDTAPSNLLTDLLWYLATDKDTGAGKIINPALVDREALVNTAKYLRANRLFWDGSISESVNLRTWLATTAPSVLCFTSLKNGRLALEPALPYHADGVIDTTNPILISAMFTEGNIIEDSLEIDWLELEERKLFQCAIIFNISRPNQFPEQRTLIARYTDVANSTELPIEEFDLPHINSIEHAQRVARYFLAVRRYQTHTITFKTLPWGLNLEPGQFIRVASEMSPYRPDSNGIIDDQGNVTAVNALADGNYPVYYWERNNTTIEEGLLEIKAGKATELFNTVFSVKTSSYESSQIYQIEALDVDQDGIVTIKGSNYPVDSNGRSLLAIDAMGFGGNVEFVGGGNE